LNEIRDTSGSSSELIQLPVCSIAWIKSDDSELYTSGTVVSVKIIEFFRIFLSIIKLTEKSFCVHSMFPIAEMIGRELLAE